jgi:rod shape determining protein RodA
MLLLIPPVALIFLQPDVGTLIVVAMIWVGLSIIAGVRLRYLFGLAALILVSLPKVYDIALHSYMRDRIETFLNPDLDPLGRGYNVIQAEISIGSGGLLGKGILGGTQTQLNYLRVQNTDFIFSVLGEEFGYVGAMVLFSLFVILLFRSLNAAASARDNFGRLIVTGVVITILVQAFINIAVNVRLLPATGIPLPFVSFGGTALLTLMLSLGVVESVQARRSRA